MVFVTGGTGFIGCHVVRALVGAGERVRALVRPTSRREELPAAVEAFEGDLADRERLRRGLEGCATLYHCAADYRLGAPDPERLHEVNVEGTDRVLGAAADAGVARVVHTSSVGALGTREDGAPADETTPAALERMIGAYKRSKFLAERVAESWHQRGLAVVIVNPSTPVGEADARPTPTGQIIVDFLNGKMPAYVDTRLNLIDVRDVAAGHLLAAARGRPGERYILGHRNMTLAELLQGLASIAGRAAPRVRLPHWVPMALATLEAPLAWARRRPARIPLESVRMARRNMSFDASKAVRELGLPQSPIEPALARAVAWYRERGYVRA
jgi:dihydroflavonol-4-reductase